MHGFLSLATVVIGSTLLLAPLGAQARETEHNLSAEAAATSDFGVARLYDVPFFMKNQKHPKVLKILSEATSEQSTRGAFRSDEASCQVAFLSCLRDLQERARAKGGNAIVDLVSITWNKQTESATDFRCIAGSMVVHVGLKGKIVKIAE